MDVYHKILIKIYEESGGKETVNVDLVDLLKREGFFPSLNVIATQLSDEGWITETSHKHIVRLTHWGRSEAKRSMSDQPDKGQEAAKDAQKLVSLTKEFLVMVEEIAGKPTADKVQPIEDKLAMIGPALKRLKDNLS